MQVSTTNNVIKDLYMQRLTKDEVKEIKQAIVDNANKYTFTNFSKFKFASKDISVGQKIQNNIEDFQKFLYANGIDGKSVTKVSQLTFTNSSFLDIKV